MYIEIKHLKIFKSERRTTRMINMRVVRKFARSTKRLLSTVHQQKRISDIQAGTYATEEVTV